jgi:hypothetical protein
MLCLKLSKKKNDSTHQVDRFELGLARLDFALELIILILKLLELFEKREAVLGRLLTTRLLLLQLLPILDHIVFELLYDARVITIFTTRRRGIACVVFKLLGIVLGLVLSRRTFRRILDHSNTSDEEELTKMSKK